MLLGFLLTATVLHPPGRPALLGQRATLCVMMADDDDAADDGALIRPLNKYVEEISDIPAPELIQGFAETAPQEVQSAIRQTVVSLLGNLPAHLYETSVMSTGQNVASLMYSMQMTGYMFRNAEYRRSLLQSLNGDSPSAPALTDGASGELPPVSGKIKVKLAEELETMVDATAYMAELRSEVEQLRSELLKAREASVTAQGGGLLSYMQSLGRENVAELTSSISQEVLDAMRSLIENVLGDAGVGGEQLMETSGLKLRELLVWQLITGYKLRELEAKEELERSLQTDEADEADEEGDGDGEPASESE